MPEILHLQMKPSASSVHAPSSTVASSRSESPGDSDRVAAIPRSKTVGGIATAELDMEYPSGLVSRDYEEDAPIRRSKTAPGLDAVSLAKDYPTGLVVRNTFLEFPVEQPVFVEVRRARSAPSSPMAGGRQIAPQVLPTVEPAILQISELLGAPKSYAPPQLGSPQMPTAGSAQHNLGQCKPCAFFWKPAGCGNGVECPFCHLCGPDEKKRRQKDKKAFLKACNRNN